LAHATGALQLAVTSHVWTPLPEHCFWPGVHVPVQTPPLHDWLHAAAEPQLPFAPHVSTPLAEHCVAPGTHTPVHVPIAQA
jgi:hypothetical protein